MRLKDFAPQRVRATQSCAKEGTPSIYGTASAALIDFKAHVIANKS
jgi:hypothetical protein